MGTTVARPAPNQANGILRNETIAAPLKYLSNFWKSLEMPWINCKVESKLKWTKQYISNNITFTIKDTKLCVPVVSLSAKGNKKLTNLLSKGFEISVYQNRYKAKSETKITTNEYRNFPESNFVGVNRLFVLVYPNRDNNTK